MTKAAAREVALNDQTNDGLPTALVVRIVPRADAKAEFSAWHARMATVPACVPGFIGAEVTAPAHPGRVEWNVVQRFRSPAALRAWRASEHHQRLLQEARTLLDDAKGGALREEEVAQAPGEGAVTEVVTTRVRPGKDDEYREWASRIHSAEAQFPGYRGGRLQPPVADSQRYWMTLVRFATPEQLDAWLNSDIRRELLREHDALVQSWEHHRLPGSFAGWFPAQLRSGASPPNWKQSMLVLLMLFPIVVLELRYLMPHLGGLNRAAAAFVGNVISVFALGLLFMPFTIARMNWWLQPRKDRAARINLGGIALLVTLYAAEITLLSLLW